MDQKITLDDLLAVVRADRNNQKAQFLRINELEKKDAEVDSLKIRIAKLEDALEKEKTQTDNRFDNAIERFEGISSTIEDQEESISSIEEKQKDVETKLKEVDDNIKDLDIEIRNIEKETINKERENKKENKNVSYKRCRFNNSGYCKAKTECNFYHSESLCEQYIGSGFCSLMSCRKRHPKNCRFFLRGNCTRLESCAYLHKSTKQAFNISANDSNDYHENAMNVENGKTNEC